jgi:hypothetical protein
MIPYNYKKYPEQGAETKTRPEKGTKFVSRAKDNKSAEGSLLPNSPGKGGYTPK